MRKDLTKWVSTSEQMERNFKHQHQSTRSSLRLEQYTEISSKLELIWPSNFGFKLVGLHKKISGSTLSLTDSFCYIE